VHITIEAETSPRNMRIQIESQEIRLLLANDLIISVVKR
jgi:hypothetical protein